MTSPEFADTAMTEPEIDDEGYLIHPENWSPEIAVDLASSEEIDLSETHWIVIDFIRRYFDDHQVAPDARHVMSYLANLYRMDKKAAKSLLFDLFPYGYVRQACKISGMRRPRAWSTG